MASLEHAGVAFLMVVVAGLATCVGAAAVFCECLVTLASKRVLAAGLSFSAGIMLYVSFIEIFQKAKGGFEDAGMEENHAYMASTLCLFAGMLIIRLLVLLSHFVDRGSHEDMELAVANGKAREVKSESTEEEESEDVGGVEVVAMSPVAQEKQAHDKKLLRMGLNTALAIAIHNFPEGVAGMVAGLIDPSVGFTLTMAIAIHNIPEGLCIALPIFYATGSRCKGFLLAAFSGLTEPIGAVIAWAIVARSGEDMHGVVYGTLFGLVGGIMVMIVALELLPTAHRYDPKDTVVTHGFVAGMIVMASSLVLFLV